MLLAKAEIETQVGLILLGWCAGLCYQRARWFSGQIGGLHTPRLEGVRKQGARDQTVRRLRPLARRRLSTMRPFLVAMRARKPWARLRLMTLGWNVLFMVHLFINGQLATDLTIYKPRYKIAKASEKEAALYRMAGGVAITSRGLL